MLTVYHFQLDRLINIELHVFIADKNSGEY